MSDSGAPPVFDPSKPFTRQTPVFDPSKPFTRSAIPRGAEASQDEGTTLSGFTGAVTRGLAPIAAGAGVGTALGAPIAGVGAIPGMALGAGAMGLTELATSIYNPLAKHFGWPETATPQEMTDRVLDVFGVKRPTTMAERQAEAIAGGAASALGPAKAAATIAETAGSPIAKDVAAALAEQPALQAVSGATGAASSEAAREGGFGPTGQFVAGELGGMLAYPLAVAPMLVRSAATPAARSAIESGYVFPPAEIPPLGEKPRLVSTSLAALAGKIKTQQEASTKNQENTNRLAAQEIGLHPDRMLNEEAFREALLHPASIYEEVRQSVPEVSLGDDGAFRTAIGRIGAGKSMVEKFFPQLANAPSIRGLRKMLLAHGTIPTDTAMQLVSDLRFNAGLNLRAVGDAQKHALGIAQRHAAAAIEDAIDRSVQNAPQYYAKKFSDALAARHRASGELTGVHTKLTKAAADLATHSNVYKVSAAMRAGREAERSLEAIQARYDAADRAIEHWRDKLRTAHARDGDNKTLLDRYRGARTRFAKIYNVYDATNRTTGNVSAQGLARLYNRGHPLTENLKTIADAYNAAPRAMQVPESFGHSEDYSALDFFGFPLAAISGHPEAALSILLRKPVRQGILSRPYQRAIVSEPHVSAPAAVLINPGAAAATQQQESNK